MPYFLLTSTESIICSNKGRLLSKTCTVVADSQLQSCHKLSSKCDKSSCRHCGTDGERSAERNDDVGDAAGSARHK